LSACPLKRQSAFFENVSRPDRLGAILERMTAHKGAQILDRSRASKYSMPTYAGGYTYLFDSRDLSIIKAIEIMKLLDRQMALAHLQLMTDEVKDYVSKEGAVLKSARSRSRKQSLLKIYQPPVPSTPISRTAAGEESKIPREIYSRRC